MDIDLEEDEDSSDEEYCPDEEEEEEDTVDEVSSGVKVGFWFIIRLSFFISLSGLFPGLISG